MKHAKHISLKYYLVKDAETLGTSKNSDIYTEKNPNCKFPKPLQNISTDRFLNYLDVKVW